MFKSILNFLKTLIPTNASTTIDDYTRPDQIINEKQSNPKETKIIFKKTFRF